jgi:cytochrome c biogenesis factor
VTPLLALLQEAGADEEGSRQLFGYVIIVAGVMDLLTAAFIVAVVNMDPDKKRNVGMILGMAGFGMIAIGILVAAGVLL